MDERKYDLPAINKVDMAPPVEPKPPEVYGQTMSTITGPMRVKVTLAMA